MKGLGSSPSQRVPDYSPQRTKKGLENQERVPARYVGGESLPDDGILADRVAE